MPLVSYERRHLEEQVLPDGADKRRWGVALYRVEGGSLAGMAMQHPRDAGWRYTMEQHGFVKIEDDIDTLDSYYAQRRYAPIAKLAVIVDDRLRQEVRRLWVHGWLEAPPINAARYLHWWQYVRPFPWRGGKRRRHA